MQTGSWQTLIPLFRSGADLSGLCLLTALLAVSAWVCLRQQPVSEHRAAPAQTHGFYLMLCTLAAPLLMFFILACGLALVQQAQPLPATSVSKSYRSLLWLLYGLVGLQQLYALHRLASQPAARLPLGKSFAAGALLLLPLATALGLLALDRVFFQHAGMPRAFMAAAALAAVSGIALWMPAQRLMPPGGEPRQRTEPAPAAQDTPHHWISQPDLPGAVSTAQQMETKLNEISRLLEQETARAEQASQHELLEQQQVAQASTMQQQVNEQKFLFESGLPFNLALLVNGLIILEQPLDLRDHVRGDSLLHAAARAGNFQLADQLIENGVDVAAVNWAGVTARACTQDTAILDRLEAAARMPK
ncbi:MAG: hypothetical protein ABWY05_04220 [Noviherbaspirillum sp.]